MGILINPLIQERSRWVLWIPVAFASGIGGYFALLQEPPFWLGPAVTLTATVIAIWISYASTKSLTKEISRTNSFLVSALAFAIGVAIAGAGFTAAQWRTQAVATPLLEKRIGPTTVSGQVLKLENYSNGLRVTLGTPHIANLSRHLTPVRVRLRLRGTQPAVLPGDWLDARAILSPPSPPAMPGAFDFQRRAYFQSVGAVGFSLGKARVSARAGEASTFSVANALARLRVYLTQKLMSALPGMSGAVAAALITGERHAIPTQVIDAMRDSGLAHLLAISGLHIGLVAGLLFAALRALTALIPFLALRYPTKKWAAVLALGGAFAYALIAGATLPTQRAFLMLAIALLGVLLDRRGLSLRSVAWAALAVLALQPESLLGASFQMSFAAVTALVAVYESYTARRLYGGDGKPAVSRRLAGLIGLYLSGVLLTTFVAGTATAPFAIFHFNRFADFGLAANLLAVPVTALWVMPWAIVAIILLPFGGEHLALVPMGWGITTVVEIAETIASWPGAVTLMPAMPVWGLVTLSIGGLWMCIWRRRWRYGGGVAVIAGIISIAFVSAPDILVDRQGRIMAINGADKRLMLSNVRRNRFERDIWARRLANQVASDAWPATGSALAGALSCDIAGCIYRRHTKTVALIRHERALLEDCWSADAVISLLPVRGRCPASLVIDKFDLWRNGAHAIWLDGNAVRIQTVNDERGERPWVMRPARRPRPPSN
jgi:competence protein ComEC